MSNYDVILVFKGMEVRRRTLITLRNKGIYLFNYNPDHPFVYFGRGSGNKNVLQSIKLYHHHFSYSKRIIQDLKNKFQVSASWLPFAYEECHKPITEDEINAVCFIGNADRDRAEAINELILNRIHVDVFGNNWRRFLKPNPYLKIHKPVYGKEFITVAQKYRIQLNLFRPQNIGSHNMRSFEMPSLGCIMLAPYSEEHDSFFKANEEAFYFKKDSLVTCVKHILNLDPIEALKIRENAYNRCVTSNYHYRDRIKVLYETINNFNK